MSKRRGHIKYYRDALDNPLFCKKPFDDWHAFDFFMLKCQRFPCDVELKDGTKIHLDIGQLFISRKKLADIFGWSVKKLRAWENRLFHLNMVTVEGKRKGMVYTLKNYASHQLEGQPQGHEEGQPQGQPQGQSKKKGKERIKKETSRSGDFDPPLEVIPMPDYIRQKIEEVL